MNSPSETIKKINEYDQEYWSARELMSLLGYVEWRKFEGTIKRAQQSCVQNNQPLEDHIVGVANMVSIGSGATQEFSSYQLSR